MCIFYLFVLSILLAIDSEKLQQNTGEDSRSIAVEWFSAQVDISIGSEAFSWIQAVCKSASVRCHLQNCDYIVYT